MRRRIEQAVVFDRQQRMRMHHAIAASATEAETPVSAAWIAVLPDGTVRTTVHHVAHEQVPSIISALDALRADVAAFGAPFQAQSFEGARVVTLAPRATNAHPPDSPMPRAA